MNAKEWLGTEGAPPALLRGTRVRATVLRTGEGDYTTEAIVERRNHDGQVGTVIGFSNSHGLCYEVRFEEGTAWFDPQELVVLASMEGA